MKKLIRVLTLTCILTMLLCVTSFATSYTITSKTQEIPTTLQTTLLTLKIDSPTGIAQSLLAGFTKLTKVTVTGRSVIDEQTAAFACPALTEVVMERGANVTYQRAFSDYKGIIRFYYSELNNTNIIDNARALPTTYLNYEILNPTEIPNKATGYEIKPYRYYDKVLENTFLIGTMRQVNIIPTGGDILPKRIISETAASIGRYTFDPILKTILLKTPYGKTTFPLDIDVGQGRETIEVPIGSCLDNDIVTWDGHTLTVKQSISDTLWAEINPLVRDLAKVFVIQGTQSAGSGKFTPRALETVIIDVASTNTLDLRFMLFAAGVPKPDLVLKKGKLSYGLTVRDVNFGDSVTDITNFGSVLINLERNLYLPEKMTSLKCGDTGFKGTSGVSKLIADHGLPNVTSLNTSGSRGLQTFDISDIILDSKIKTITGTNLKNIFEYSVGLLQVVENTYVGNWFKNNFANAPAHIFISPVVPTGITLDKSNYQLAPTETYQFKATIIPSNATDKSVTWNSSDPAVGTVVSGLFTAIKEGTTTIAATNASGQSATCVVQVKQPVLVDRIIVEAKQSVEIDKTMNINATALPADADDLTLEYVSADPTIASIGTTGIITGNKEGKTNITVTAKGNPSVTAVVEVTVIPKKVSAPVEITVSAPAGYTSQKVPITITTTGSVKYIQLPNGNIVNAQSFTYYATQNGSYTFTAVGELGDQATAKQIITTMDKINPIITINSIITDTETIYEINVIDTESGFKSLTLPDKSVITSLPYTYHQTESGTVTITASDNASNITAKELTRGQISIPGTSSTTFIAYEGIPKEWTNQPANIQVAAFNPVDGVDLAIGPATAPKMRMFSMFSAPELSKTAVFKDVTVTENSTIPVTVTSVDGANQVIPLVIDKIDTTPPEATFTIENGLVTVIATDTQSGVREVINPAGEVADTFTAEFDGTYRFMLVDNADNATPFDVAVTMGAEPPVPILPPAELTESGTQAVEIIGTVMPVGSGSSTLLSVVIPTSLDFVIDADRKFIGADYTFKNTGTSNAVISITEVTPLEGTTTQIVTPNKYADWTSLDKDATRNFIALMLGDVSLHAPAELTKLPAGSTKYLTLSGKYGHAWDNVTSLLLKYKVSLHITTTP